MDLKTFRFCAFASCLAVAALLAYRGKEGWGWFLVVAVLFLA